MDNRGRLRRPTKDALAVLTRRSPTYLRLGVTNGSLSAFYCTSETACSLPKGFFCAVCLRGSRMIKESGVNGMASGLTDSTLKTAVR
jgi:hypothetical protein